jgi:hypothetical protein
MPGHHTDPYLQVIRGACHGYCETREPDMTIPTAKLTRAAGLSAVVKGLVSAVTYLLGGLLFGVALSRAGVLARWAALLLAVGTVVTLLLPLLPHAIGRMAAVPVGVALAGLGYSLWHGQRTAAGRSLPSVRSSQLDPADAE